MRYLDGSPTPPPPRGLASQDAEAILIQAAIHWNQAHLMGNPAQRDATAASLSAATLALIEART